QITKRGHKIETGANEERQITLSGLYNYPTSLRGDLATVAPMVDKIKKGDWLHVKGTVVEQAVDMSLFAFQVPFGDVVAADVTRRSGKFEGRLRFKEEGHYRVQVQVELPGIRTFTAVHHAVVVGQPYPLEPTVLLVEEYLGDREGALTLIELANRERVRLGRKEVTLDEDLTDIAQSRLREMTLKGEVSHVSISGEDVRDHMIRKRMRFLAVGENVASAHYLETMHWGWMMSSGHRKTLLNPRWAYVGVAVTEINGMLWGVQVFAGW
ncbi:MAG: CAP domain-containing protein, partial [Candidatus Latescibacteria bacterium]|nr:CAP domain-containing protein [Candidatus Latescibacterota bacterium]